MTRHAALPFDCHAARHPGADRGRHRQRLALDGYTPFVLALVALTTVVGVGLNVLVGLAGQISLGHVGFYAIGAYAVAILTIKGVSFWLALPLAGAIAGAVGALLALPAMRVTGPYLAMVTIAFAFIVEHGTIEWRDLTGGQNGLMGIVAAVARRTRFREREMAALAVLLAGCLALFFQRLAAQRVGQGHGRGARQRDRGALDRLQSRSPSRPWRSRSRPIFAGLAGALFAPLMMFVAPEFVSVLAVDPVPARGDRRRRRLDARAGARRHCGVVLPELLSSLAEYRLLFFGGLLLVVLWLAPEGIVGTLARYLPRDAGATAGKRLRPRGVPGAGGRAAGGRDIGIAFGGVKAARTSRLPPHRAASPA